MSTTKISDLPVLSSADAADEFVVVDDSAGVTKKITQAGLADFGSNTLTAGLVNATGVNFGADTLDDYEEGTWTPVYGGEDSDPIGTYHSSTFGKYIKVGNYVHVFGRLRGGAQTSTGSGELLIKNLPFSIANLPSDGGSVDIGLSVFFNSANPVAGFLRSNTDFVRLTVFSNSSALSSLNNANTSNLSSGLNDNLLLFSISYVTD